MRDTPIVSIVLPARNAGETISAALENIRAQTFTAWELVVVDDGSHDETPPIESGCGIGRAHSRAAAARQGGSSLRCRQDVAWRLASSSRCLKCEYLTRWLNAHVPQPRELWLWGAGRITRQRFRDLEAAGHPFSGFVDIDTNKSGRRRDGRRVVGPDELPDAKCALMLGSARGT